MGAENTKTFEVPQSAPIQELDIEDNQTESAPYAGPRLRDSRDMAAFGVGTAAGFLADSMQRHRIQEKINDQNKTQADAAYMAQMRMELQRMQDAEYRRQIDARNELIRQQQAQYQQELEAHAQAVAEAKANEPKLYGTGTQNWTDQEYAEKIARQIDDPLSKGIASKEAEKRIAMQLKAEELFPSQMLTSKDSLLTIPLVTGGQTKAPMSMRKEKPEPAPLPPPPSKPVPPPIPQRTPIPEPQPRAQAPELPSKMHSAGSGLMGGLAGADLFDAYQNFRQGNIREGLTSAGTGLSAAAASYLKNPKLRALLAAPSILSKGSGLLDYFNAGEPEQKKAEGGMIHMAGGGLAPHGMRHSGEGAKGKGYFGMMPSQDIGEGPVDYSLAAQPRSSELSLESDGMGEYPSLVPGLTKEEMDYMLAGNEPTESILQKAKMHAMMRKGKGMSPFAQPDELRYPVPNYRIGGAVKKGAQTVFAHLANRYPSLIPGILKIDKEKGKEYLGKALSDEEKALQKARKAAQKDINAGNYTPFFDVSQRFYVDPKNYPMTGNTLTDAMPKKADTIANYRQQFDTPEIITRLREAYGKAKGDPLAHHFYAMGQLENEFIKELGPDLGREMFRKRFAEPMAATTSGADPTANLLSAYYANHMRQAGLPMGGAAHELPHPVGGRFIMGNLDQYDKIINKGIGIDAASQPKRFNFSSNFMGHKDRQTMDEQMMGVVDPTRKHKAPPGDSYGIVEGVSNKAAAMEGVDPINFQEVAWAGTKGEGGKPMIQHINEAIERTARVTGKTPDEVLRDSIIHARSPLYGGAAVGLGGLGQYEDQR